MEPTTPPPVHTEKNTDEWPLGELYRKAYKIATKNPVLWWFSLAIGAGMGSYQGSGGDISPSDTESLQKLFNGSGAEQAEKVLGAATNSSMDLFGQIMQAIPWYFYAILIGEILLLVIFGVVISLIYKAWAEASLLNGIEDSIAEKKPTMQESSEKAFPLIASFIWLQIVPGMVFGLLSFALIGMLVLLFVVVPDNLKVIIGILLFLVGVVFLIGLLYLTMALIWAPRKIVTDKIAAREAFFKGLHIAHKKFWKTILFGMLNNIVTLFTLGIAVGIPLIIFLLLGVLAGFLWKGAIAISITLISVIVILGIVWIVALTLLFGIVDTFKAAFWSLAYHKIKGKYEH